MFIVFFPLYTFTHYICTLIFPLLLHFHHIHTVPSGNSFTAQEDAIIMENVGACPAEFCSWQVLADTKLPGRTGKQIRDRWNNYLNPVLNHNAWSAEEDQRLWEAQAEYGRKWTVIGLEKFHTTRSENQLKNRYYSAGFKRFVRENYGQGAYEGAKIADEERIVRESSPPESNVKRGKVADKVAPVVSVANKPSSSNQATGDIAETEDITHSISV